MHGVPIYNIILLYKWLQVCSYICLYVSEYIRAIVYSCYRRGNFIVFMLFIWLLYHCAWLSSSRLTLCLIINKMFWHLLSLFAAATPIQPRPRWQARELFAYLKESPPRPFLRFRVLGHIAGFICAAVVVVLKSFCTGRAWWIVFTVDVHLGSQAEKDNDEPVA